MKICIVSSCGGHLTEVRMLLPEYSNLNHFYVLNHPVDLPDDMRSRTYFIDHSQRDFKFFINLVQAFKILRREKPTIILSTGAGPVVPFALINVILGRASVIFIESMACINRPSVTGRIMYYFSDKFFYQWPMLKKYYPKGIYGGLLI